MLIGTPPCQYAFLGLGSLARQEMSPYSDLEYVLLIEKSTPEILSYFKKLVRWLEIQTIHLGETQIKILGNGQISPIDRGFSYDDGGNTPLGKEEKVELIQTTSAMAQFQTERYYQEDFILSNILKSASFLLGNIELYHSYVKSVSNILSSPSTKPIREQRALNDLKGHLQEFEPKLDKKKEDNSVFNIKAELYRLPSFLIGVLADYYGLQDLNTWDKLAALVKMRVLSSEGAENIKKALDAIMRLRMRCHLFYKQECDDAYHPATIKDMNSKSLFVFNDDDTKEIVRIFVILLPMHRVFKEASVKGHFRDLAKAKFYDDSPCNQGIAFQRLQKFDEAKKCCHQALALNPLDISAYIHLINIHTDLSEYSEAAKLIENAVTKSNQVTNKEDLINLTNVQAIYYQRIGNKSVALDLHKKVLEYARQYYVDANHPNLGCILTNLAVVLGESGQLQQALEYSTEAIGILKKSLGNSHETIAVAYNNMGVAHSSLGHWDAAVACYQESLKMSVQLFGESHPQVAMSMGGLGRIAFYKGENDKAAFYLENSLKIFEKLYGREHSTVAIRLSLLGGVYSNRRQYSELWNSYKKPYRFLRERRGNLILMLYKHIPLWERYCGKWEILIMRFLALKLH